MTTWTTPPGSYSAFASTNALLVGPHNRFVRNGIVFNDRSQLECFWVEDMTGFESTDIEASATPSIQETGENPDPGRHGGRTMTLTGWIQAGSYPTMMRMGRALLDSFIDIVEMPMQIVTADASYFTQPAVWIGCRPADKVQLSMQVQPSDIRGVIKRNFTITLRASDPTYKSVDEHYATLIPQVTSIPGRPYDRIYDITYTSLLDYTGSVTGAGPNVATLTNSGNDFAPVRLRATGYMEGITVVNDSTGQVMYFTDVGVGQYIEIDTSPTQGTIRDQTGAQDDARLDMRSDWMTLRGIRGGSDGTNRVFLFVEGYAPGAKLEIWHRDTSI